MYSVEDCLSCLTNKTENRIVHKENGNAYPICPKCKHDRLYNATAFDYVDCNGASLIDFETKLEVIKWHEPTDARHVLDVNGYVDQIFDEAENLEVNDESKFYYVREVKTT